MSDSDLSRRRFIAGLGGTAAGAVALGPATIADALNRPSGGRAPHPRTPTEALRVLQAGNKRYQREKLQLRDYSPVGERRAAAQKPFAAIITCADSRISPELVFDVERGNLFVSRIAGNSIDTGTLGSTEYAVAVLGVKLVLVLGHSDCGAVKAAIEVANGNKSYPASKYGAIGDVVDHVVAQVKTVPSDQRTLKRCTPVNARGQASELAGKGPIIAPALADGKLRVVAAIYDISNGKVSIIP